MCSHELTILLFIQVNAIFFTSIHQKPGGLPHILPAVVFSSTLQVNFEKISCNIEVSRPRPTFLLRS